MDDPEVSYQLQEILKTATNWVIAKGSAVLLSVPKLLVHFFILFLTMFYTLRDGHLLLDKIHQLMELRRQDFIFILQRLRQSTKKRLGTNSLLTSTIFSIFPPFGR